MENNIIQIASQYAIMCHRETNHLYDGKPYEIHLQMVYEVACKYVNLVSRDHVHNFLAATWCHDLIEDCRQTYNDVAKETNKEVADLVYAVTNEKGKIRDDRANEKYYKEMGEVPFAKLLKICDRIANYRYSIERCSDMAQKYWKEGPMFVKHINPGFTLADPLKELQDLDRIWVEKRCNLSPASFGDKVQLINPPSHKGWWIDSKENKFLNPVFGREGNLTFSTSGDRSNSYISDNYPLEKMNTKRIVDFLAEEATKQGFKKGVNFKVSNLGYCTFSGKFGLRDDHLVDNDSGCKIFNADTFQWAIIIPEEKPVVKEITWQSIEIKELRTGDIIRGKSKGVPYVVTANYGNRVTAVCSVDVTNPLEWEVLTLK